MPGRGESLPKPSSKFPEKNINKNTPDHLYITKKIIIEKIAEYFTVVSNYTKVETFWNYLKNPSQEFKNSFRFRFL